MELTRCSKVASEMALQFCLKFYGSSEGSHKPQYIFKQWSDSQKLYFRESSFPAECGINQKRGEPGSWENNFEDLANLGNMLDLLRLQRKRQLWELFGKYK